MLENILLASTIFSDLIIRIYYNDTVPIKWIDINESFNHVELIFMDEHYGHLMLFGVYWHFMMSLLI